MPRNASGNYTLPAGNPVVTGTTIASTWANPTLSDVGTELEDSLSRTGKGGMLAPLKHTAGTKAAPSLTFGTEPQSGWYLAGVNDLRLSIAGVDAIRVLAGQLQIWVAADAAFYPVVSAKTAGAVVETQTLAALQTVVEFTNNVAGAALYLDGTSGDRGRLLLGTDYTYDAVANEVTLTTDYPDGTQLFAVINDENDVVAAAAAASDSASAAATSESNAADSETAAANSETAAGNSETAAANSETAAGLSETAAANSESAAALSETAAGNSETAAANSETAAGLSATAASDSETAAGLSAAAASDSEALAEEWATSLTVVSGGFKGSRGYAEDAAAIVATIPEGTIDDTVTTLTDTWSSQKISEGDLTRYDLDSVSTTATLDFDLANQFTVDASSPRTLAFANVPASKAITAVITISGASAITWPGVIRWNGDGTTAPTLGATWTVIVLNYDGTDWSGALGASA